MKEDNQPINIFDFDGTLTTETWPKYWVWVKKFGYHGEERNDELEAALAKYRSIHEGSLVETFFGFFNDLLKYNDETLTNEELLEGENYIVYNPGVEEHLKNTPAKNYIISGGLIDFIKKLRVGKYIEEVYGTPVIRNENGLITGIEKVMTDDKKVDAIKDILRKNNREENDCHDVFYIGDGYSDAEAMRFVHKNGGKTIFVHQPHQDDGLYEFTNNVYEKLNEDGIVDYRCIADYTNGSELSNLLNRKI